MSRKGSRRARQGRPKRWQDGLRFIVGVATTPGVSRESFSHLFILSKAVGHWAERVRKYETAEDVARDFQPMSREYAAACSYFSHGSPPAELWIGVDSRDALPSPLTITVAPPAIGKLEVFANGKWNDYDATGETVERVAEGISALVNGDPSTATGDRLDELASLTCVDR